MKKRLNLVTFLIGIAVGISLWNFIKKEFNDMSSSFMEGYSEGYNRDNYSTHWESCYLVLEPKEFSAMPDSVYNKKTGEWVPARVMETYVRVPIENRTGLEMLWLFPCIIALIVGFFMVVFNFIAMIISVNKSIIFDWINVKRLRRVGIGFILLFVVVGGVNFYHNNMTSKLIEIENYNIITYSLNGDYLMFGMIAFLIAEIFAVGLRLKEEQELTI